MPDSSAPRQTQSYLIRRFAEAGLRPQVRHGQNFLIDLNLLELLADSADLGPDDVVLEIGTGLGSLSAIMAGRAAAVVTVEIDPYLHQLASEELIDCPNVTLLHQDALHNKNTISATVLDSVRARLAEAPGRRFKLAANLPYNIATPVLTNLLASDLPPRTMTVTIQKELADRLVAVPSTPDYGALAVWVQSQCNVTIVRVMPPAVFWPRPKVHSAIVHIELDEARRAAIPDLAFFHSFARAVFQHRRKLLRGVLRGILGDRLSKPEIDDVMAGLELSSTARAEELGVTAILALCEAVRPAVASR
jgi:16S rRNA (adenine1518-N6/adenine1519-N6)-dimethyltransferase